MKLKKSWIQVSAFALSLSLAACTDRTEQPIGQPGEAGGETSQIIERDVETQEMGRIGEQAEQTGEAQVQGEREIVRRETEQFQEQLPTVTEGTKKADINRMDVNDFAALGLSRPLAERITQYREQNGNFASVDELSQVPGMDTNWLNQHRNALGTSTQAAGQAGNE